MALDVQTQNHSCVINDLGVISYQSAYDVQMRCVSGLLKGEPQTLLLCEHPLVITLGRMSKREHLLVSQDQLDEQGVDVLSIDRGGDITLHCPGQLVVYPIFNLNHYGKDLRAYLHQLEQVAIDLLSEFGILANRISSQTGVWVKKDKIVSVGIGVKKWISFHGIGINVNTDLNHFKLIKPCGLNVAMSSIARIKGVEQEMDKVKSQVKAIFKRHFQLDYKD